jgi:hypothetical protein
MGLESLPSEAITEMRSSFEGLEPVISETDLRSLCEGNSELEDLLESMLTYALRYAVDVWNMHTFVNNGGLMAEDGSEKFAEIDSARTRLHNALVDSIAILSRALSKSDKNNEWVRDLSGNSGLERAKCGAFALLLVYRRYLDKT